MTTNSPAYMKLYREKKRKDFAAGLVDPDHGKENTYSLYGCRCKPCSQAHEAYRMELNARVDQRALYENYTKPWRHQTPPGTGRSSGKRWTSEEIELVTAREPSGEYTHTAPEAAKQLGRTISAVTNRRHAEATKQPTY